MLFILVVLANILANLGYNLANIKNIVMKCCPNLRLFSFCQHWISIRKENSFNISNVNISEILVFHFKCFQCETTIFKIKKDKKIQYL